MKKETTNEELAQMVAKGFESVDKQFHKVDQRFDKVDQRFDKVDQRFDKVEKRLSIIEFEITELAHRAELEQLKSRIARLEEKVGISS